MEISGKTKLAALIGHPVEHSFSPYIHNYLAKRYGLDMRYMCFDIEHDNVEKALEGVRVMGLLGSNVTIPHKIAVLEHLDQVEPNAQVIGAVNCIKNDQGKLLGYNTDGVGFVKSVIKSGHQLTGKKVMLLGAGGACRAVAVELAAAGVSSLTIRNHTIEKAKSLALQVASHFPKVKVSWGDLEIEDAQLREVEIVINTTPLGMSSRKDLSPLKESLVPPTGLLVCDIVYTPHETKLLHWAKSHNLQVVHGIGMLIYQALYSFYLWTGIECEDAYEDIIELLKQKGVIE